MCFCSNSTCHGVEWPEVQLDAEQVHPMPLEGRHAELWCQDCHQDERKPDDACASCHQRPHDWGDETCDACHLLDGWVPARSGQGARTGPSPCEGDAGDTARLWSRVVTREEMDLKRIACVSLCLLLFVAALMACTPVPIEISPAPAHPDVTLEEWAARYPNEYRDWEDSVHGTAYLAGDPDAPGCTDCHGDPETGEIQTAAFRLGIPARCARCHADEDIMSRHDLPSDTYATFVADDYHGKTVAYYWHNDPTVWRYEAVCSDCHLSHAVYGPDDPKSSVSEANLLDTCQKCHLGATPNFVDFASGHFRWSRMGAPLVHYVSLAYKILIPLVIGLMLAYIGLDIYHRLRSRFGRETS